MQKKYFHDRLVLLLLTINTFLTMLCAVLVLLRLDNRVSGYIGYIVEYRASRGLGAYKIGDTSAIAAFIIFVVVILLFNTFLSMRAHQLHRQFSITILALGTLLAVLAIIVSNALLILR